MKTIKYRGYTIVAVYRLTQTTDGNHVPYKTKTTYTLFTDHLQQIRITEFEFEQSIQGSGIPLYSGTVTRGGGRHSFHGTDINDVPDLINSLTA